MKIQISYTPTFIKQYSKLPHDLQIEVKEKIELFKQDQNHPFLKTHKLKGRLKKFWSFSVNYSTRIIFNYDSKTVVALLQVEGHEVYK